MADSGANSCEHRRFYQDVFGYTPKTFSYIISAAGSDCLKFGKSNAPGWRLKMLQTGSPLRLKIEWIWPEDIEQDMHDYFRDKWVTGEWHRVDVTEAIAVAAWLSKQKARRELWGRE